MSSSTHHHHQHQHHQQKQQGGGINNNNDNNNRLRTNKSKNLMDLRMVHDDNDNSPSSPSSPSSSSSILASPTTFSDVDSEGKPYDDNDSVCLACLNVCCVCGINRRVGGRFGTVAAGRNHQQDVSSSSTHPRLRKSKQTAPPKQQRLPPLPPRKDATDNAAWTTSAVVGVAVAAGLFGTLVSIAVFALYFLPKIEMEQRPMETHAATMRAEW